MLSLFFTTIKKQVRKSFHLGILCLRGKYTNDTIPTRCAAASIRCGSFGFGVIGGENFDEMREGDVGGRTSIPYSPTIYTEEGFSEWKFHITRLPSGTRLRRIFSPKLAFHNRQSVI